MGCCASTARFAEGDVSKKKRVDLDVRPYPILFKNYDYTSDGPNETSPGGSPYFGKPGGGEKSMGDWIKKRRKQLKKRERKLRADYFNQLIKKADDNLINEYNKLIDTLGFPSEAIQTEQPAGIKKEYQPQNTYGNYKRMSGANKELQQIAYDILSKHRNQPYGFSVPFEYDGKKYLGVIEEHDGGNVPGKHPGVSLFIEKPKAQGLNPNLQGLAQQLIELAKREGIQLIITSGYRSNEEQEKLYQQGRTTKGPVVTHAKPGSSKHNHGLAFDVAPLDKNGKPHWPEDEALWEKIGRIGESLGLKWGGRWAGFKDRPHFELAAMQSGRGLTTKLAGKVWYHGSPFYGIEDDFSNFKGVGGVLFLAPDKAQAIEYAKGNTQNSARFSGEFNPTLYAVAIDEAKLFDLRKPEHQKLYQQFIDISKKTSDDWEDWLPKMSREGFIHSHTNLPAYPFIHQIKKYINNVFDGVLLSEVGTRISAAIFNPQKTARIIDKQSLDIKDKPLQSMASSYDPESWYYNWELNQQNHHSSPV